MKPVSVGLKRGGVDAEGGIGLIRELARGLMTKRSGHFGLE
jgi:hypothetical protein